MKKLIVLFFVLFLSACRSDKEVRYSYIVHEGNDTIEINSNWQDGGVSMTFNGNSVKASVKSNSIDSTRTGFYEVIYNATYKNKEYTATRHVAVVDETKPVIQLKPGIDTISKGEVWQDSGVVVTDNSLLELNYTVVGAVDSNTTGRYVITYSAVDSSGNSSSVERIINVVE